MQQLGISQGREQPLEEPLEQLGPSTNPELQQQDQAALSSPTRPDEAALSEELSTSTAEDFQRLVAESASEAYWPKPSPVISRRTREAVLFALEALRHGRGKDYHILTPDLEEENASMADLLRGGQPPGNTTNRAQNGGSRAGPIPVSTHPPSGVRTPTDIMRARHDREARRKAEAEQRALQRQRDDEEDAIRRGQEQTSAASEGPRRSAIRPTAGDSSYQQESSSRAEPVQGGNIATGRRQENVPGPGMTGSTRQRGTSLDPGQPRPVQGQSAQAATSKYETTTGQEELPSRVRAPRRTSQNPPTAANPSIPSTQAAQPTQALNKSAFPHAFERWETLSSHWEGLTSYWIRRLQENSNELSREPLNQQMARQITDLSAAGANLFHAVVELQRLRASSERKFQRWFFETRQEQERAAEAQAELQRQLQEERQQRTEASNSVSGARAERIKAEELVKEMRRELQISKEEARRAWEELGRREQEERDRTTSLKNGEPTLVGGVQVVPMLPGTSRQQVATQRPPTREGPYTGGSGSAVVGGQPQSRRAQGRGETPEGETGEGYDYAFGQPSTSSAASDQYESSGRVSDEAYYSQHRPQPSTSRPTAASSSSSPAGGYRTNPNVEQYKYYQGGSSAETSIHQPRTTNGHVPPSTTSSEAVAHYPSEEEYEIDSQGNLRLDEEGRPIIYRGSQSNPSDEEQEYDTGTEHAYRQQYGAGVSSPPSSSRPTTSTTIAPTTRPTPASASAAPSGYDPTTPPGTSAPQGQSSVDYSGQGWGGPSATGWESITPRHRHPTRLSDVLEEDERSRTSQSLISGGGR